MPKSITAVVAGHAGQIRYGHRVAAELGPWRLRLAPRLPRSYELSASLDGEPGYWLTKRPLTLVLEVGSASWEWHDANLVVDGQKVAAEVRGMPTVVQWARLWQRGG